MTADAIDRAAGLAPGAALHALRRRRPEFVGGAEECRASVLTPGRDQGLGADLRLALARRMAALNADAALVAEYDAALEAASPSPDIVALGRGATDLPEALGAMARHADLVTRTPALATAEAIRRLEAAGLTNPQIVALSELIAFVSFEVRVVAGLRLMRSA